MKTKTIQVKGLRWFGVAVLDTKTNEVALDYMYSDEKGGMYHHTGTHIADDDLKAFDRIHKKAVAVYNSMNKGIKITRY